MHQDIYIYIYIYIMRHQRIIWSSYRKLTWVGFEPTITESPEFHSDALTDWAIRPWAQLALKADFVQPLQFHRLFSVRFHFSYCLCQLPHLIGLGFSWGNQMSLAEWTYVYGIHHRRVIWSSHRKFTWVRFEPTTTGALKKRFSFVMWKNLLTITTDKEKQILVNVYMYIVLHIFHAVTTWRESSLLCSLFTNK